MARLTIGNRDAKATARKAPPARLTAPTIDPAWGDVNVDPFAIPEHTDHGLMASELADTALWVMQWIEELAEKARKAARLQCKLLDPKLADSPYRDDAIQRSLALDRDIAGIAGDIILAEAAADRKWQALSREERGSTMADFHWRTQATDPRLIGAAWYRLGRDEQWPPGFRLRREWLRGMPMVVILDLRIFKVLDWCPNPRPDLFSNTPNDPIPMDIARQIADSRGDPR